MENEYKKLNFVIIIAMGVSQRTDYISIVCSTEREVKILVSFVHCSLRLYFKNNYRSISI